MKNTYLKYCLSVILIIGFFQFSSAQYYKEKKQEKPITRILFLFDASQSMYGRWQSDIKINIARKLMSNLLDSLNNVKNLELALRVYGHQYNYPPQVCTDTRLEVPFGRFNIKRIKHKLQTLVPKGTTPIAYSLQQTAKDFPKSGNSRNIIILITDGIEECGGDPCAVSSELQKQGIILKPFIIGIGKNFRDAFDCVGTYFDASSEDQFRKALNVVISQALNSTTAQVNLLDENSKPTETNVNMTFYDSFSGLIKYNFIHTLNNFGLPDTLLIDPLITYKLVINTIPAITLDSVKIIPGKHTIISVPAPQGYLKLKVGSNNKAVKNLQCIVRKSNTNKTLNVQNFGQKIKYLTGYYDLEILSLPRIYVDSVSIKQSSTTIIEMPMPGIVVLNKSVKGFGSLYVENNNKIVWIHNLRKNSLQESLILQPGKYRVIFRSIYSNKSEYTIDKSFTIKSGVTTTVKLY